jgi:diguanylate cyclase (GGDEF)-like protein
VHHRPADGEADSLVGFQRAMAWLRLLGLLIVATQAPFYRLLHPALLAPVFVIVLAVVVAQGRLLAPGVPVEAIRRRSLAFLVADLAAVYLIGTTFAADALWVGFYFYPLMSLEAAIIAGVSAGAVVTGLSLVVYLAQLVLYRQLGNPVETRSVIAALSLVAMSGGTMAVYAHLARRGNRHLRLLLDLTSALALHDSEADAIRHLDRRLHEATGGRVRTIAVREPGGTVRIRRGHAGDERTIDRSALGRAFGDLAALDSVFDAGEAVTLETDPWSIVTVSLGLPDWARSVTLVPIFAEGTWVGIMPVLWAVPTVPDEDRLRILYGLADQMGLALARADLAQAREIATIDRLTGLLNRRAIIEAAAAFVARAARVDGRASVLLVELDGLGKLDGRRQGDAVLRELASAVRGSLRQGDVAGRYDADRLLVIAADADEAAAAALAARIHCAVHDAVGGDGVTVAIGTAAYPDKATTAADLIEEADRALGARRPMEGNQRGRSGETPGDPVLAATVGAD